MATLATLIVRLSADSAELIRGTRKAKRELNDFTGGIEKDLAKVAKAGAGIGLAIGTGLAALTASRFAVIDELGKVADTVNIATKELAGFQLAAELTGLGAGDLNKSIQKLVRGIGDAARAPGLARDALNALGIEITDFANLDAGEQFKEVADRIQGLGTRAEQAAAANALFGRSGVALLNTLDLGREGLEAITAEAEAYGLALDRVDVKQIENTNDAITRAQSATKGFGNTIALAVSPFVRELANRFSAAAQESDGFSSVVEAGMQIAAKAISLVATGIQTLVTGFIALNVPLTAFVSLGRLAGAAVAGEFRQGLDDAAAAIELAKTAAVDAALDLRAGTFSGAVIEEFTRIREGAAAERKKLQAEIDAKNNAGTASGVIVPGFGAGASEEEERKKAETAAARRELELERIRQYLATRQELEIEAFKQRAIALEELELSAGETEAERNELKLENIRQFNEKILQAEAENAKKRADIEKSAQQTITGFRASAANAAVGLLQALAGKSKAAAIAAIALNKGLAIAQTVQNTAVASVRALADLGPIAGPPAAAAIATYGAIQIGLIAATGLVQAGSVGGGGAAIGTPANPVTTAPASAFEPAGTQGGSQLFVQISADGIEEDGLYSGAGVRRLIESIVETINDGGGRELRLALDTGG